MINKKFSFLLLFLTLTFALIKTAYCVDDEQTWNLMDLDDQVASALGVSTFIGGLIIAAVLLLMVLLPLGYLYSGTNKNPTYPCVISGFVVLTICTALTWIPWWLLVLTSVTVGLLFAGSIRNMISGKGGE